MAEGTFKMRPGRLLLPPPQDFLPQAPRCCPPWDQRFHILMDVSQSPSLPSVGPFCYFCP